MRRGISRLRCNEGIPKGSLTKRVCALRYIPFCCSLCLADGADRILCNSQALHVDFQPRPSCILIFRVHKPLGCPRDHKGHDLRDGRRKPDAGQLQQRRQEQERQQRTDRLGIYEKVGQSVLFRCVEVGCRNTDKRQKQQRCKEKRKISDDPGICLC